MKGTEAVYRTIPKSGAHPLRLKAFNKREASTELVKLAARNTMKDFRRDTMSNDEIG